MLQYSPNEKQSTVVSLNPFMHNVEKAPNILLKFCGVHTARH